MIYFSMIPFLDSNGGGSHDNSMMVDDFANAVRLMGGEFGTME